MKEYSKSTFTKTKRMFDTAIKTGCGKRVDRNTSYDEWISIPDDLKAAALFLIFFDKIMLARIKTYSHIVSDDDAVSMICEKLVKVSPKIEADEKMFSGSFIYTIIKNVLGEPLRRKSNQLVNILDSDAYYGEDDSDPVPYDVRIDIAMKSDDNLLDAVDVIVTWETLSDEQKSLIKAMVLKDRSGIKMSRHYQKLMIEDIRRIFSGFRDESDKENEMTFGDVYARDDFVECADVVMPDGSIAQYFGMTEGDGDDMKILFFGECRDYKYKASKAMRFRVTNVDWYE